MKYILLPGKNPSDELKDYHQIAFNFWSEGWSGFFAKYHPEFKVRADDFFRQDFIGLLTDEDKTPMAIHLYSIFDISVAYQLQQSYLNGNFKPSYFEKLNQLNLKNVMTFEGLMVNPAFRKTEAGRSMVPMLFSQGIQLLKTLGYVDAMIAPSRSDVGVTQFAHDGGCITIEDHQLHGFPVALIVGKKEQLHLNFLGEFQRKQSEKIFNTEANLDLIAQRSNNLKKQAA